MSLLMFRRKIFTASARQRHFMSCIATRTLGSFSPLHRCNVHQSLRFQPLGSVLNRSFSVSCAEVTPEEKREKRHKIAQLEKELQAMIYEARKMYQSVDSQTVRSSELGQRIARTYCELSRLRYSICEPKPNFAEDEEVWMLLGSISRRELNKIDFRSSSVPIDESVDAAFQFCMEEMRSYWRLSFSSFGHVPFSYTSDSEKMKLASGTVFLVCEFLYPRYIQRGETILYNIGLSEDNGKGIPLTRDCDTVICKGTSKETATTRILIINAENGNFVKGRAQAVAQLMELSEHTSCTNLFAIVTTAQVWSPLMLRVRDKLLYCGNDLIIDIHNGYSGSSTFPRLGEIVSMVDFMLEHSTAEVSASHRCI